MNNYSITMSVRTLSAILKFQTLNKLKSRNDDKNKS